MLEAMEHPELIEFGADPGKQNDDRGQTPLTGAGP
jgi:hypothetical protein